MSDTENIDTEKIGAAETDRQRTTERNHWTVYRTRFLVRARQLSEPLVFTDVLGREQHGEPGDYLVESCDGFRSIAPRTIFEDIYVPLSASEVSPPLRKAPESATPRGVAAAPRAAAVGCERVLARHAPADRPAPPGTAGRIERNALC